MSPAIDELRDLYRRRDGKLRACRHYPDETCRLRECHFNGCQRADDLLKGMGRNVFEGILVVSGMSEAEIEALERAGKIRTQRNLQGELLWWWAAGHEPAKG